MKWSDKFQQECSPKIYPEAMPKTCVFRILASDDIFLHSFFLYIFQSFVCCKTHSSFSSEVSLHPEYFVYRNIMPIFLEFLWNMGGLLGSSQKLFMAHCTESLILCIGIAAHALICFEWKSTKVRQTMQWFVYLMRHYS